MTTTSGRPAPGSGSRGAAGGAGPPPLGRLRSGEAGCAGAGCAERVLARRGSRAEAAIRSGPGSEAVPARPSAAPTLATEPRSRVNCAAKNIEARPSTAASPAVTAIAVLLVRGAAARAVAEPVRDGSSLLKAGLSEICGEAGEAVADRGRAAPSSFPGVQSRRSTSRRPSGGVAPSTETTSSRPSDQASSASPISASSALSASRLVASRIVTRSPALPPACARPGARLLSSIAGRGASAACARIVGVATCHLKPAKDGED